jgi:hypothetical protein
MSARKSSRSGSRASSRGSRKSIRNQEVEMPNITSEINKSLEKDNKGSQGSKVVHFIFILALHGSILYYLYNLEDADCNCIRDWRHNFVKGMSLLIIFISFIGLFGFDLKKQGFKWLLLIQFVLFIIDVYAFFTYVGDLNETQCACAVNKQPNLNSIMNLIRWIFAIVIVLSIVSGIAFIVLGYSLVKSISEK